jgi:hypothetical protein
MSQVNKLYDLLYDGLPHRSDEILSVVYGSEHLGLARIASRIYDLKKKGLIIRSYPDPDKRSLTWYQLIKLNFNGEEIKQTQQSVTVN